MKDPLNKDNIDELLQNTLERYEEMPSDTVWSGIERDLGQNPRRKRRFALFWATAILFATFGIAVYYFAKRSPEKSALQAGKQESKEKRESAAKAYPGESVTRTADAHDPAGKAARMQSGRSAALPGNGYHAPSAATPGKDDITRTGDIMNVDGMLSNRAAMGTQITQNQRIITDSFQLRSAFTLPVRVIRVPVVAALDKSPLNVRPLPEIASLANESKKRAPRFHAGVGFMPLVQWQSVKTVRQRPVRPGTLPVAITAEAESPSPGYAWGVDLGLEMNRRWSIWSGAHIRNLQTRTTHHAKMRRADGQWPGGSDTELRFRYMLNTPAGGVAVDVRMEQVDTTLNLPPSEPVTFELHTIQSLQYASIPLLIKYHGGKGRRQFFAGGGLSANFLISNTLEIDRFSSRSLRFRPSRFIRPLAGNDYLRTFSMDFRIGAGVRYQIGRHAGLSFESVYFGQIIGATDDPYLQTSSRSLGLNVAVWYKF